MTLHLTGGLPPSIDFCAAPGQAAHCEGTSLPFCLSYSVDAALPVGAGAPHTMINAAKDTLFSRAAQVWANSLIARYGKVQGLKIDSRRKTLEVSCQLEGEPSLITIRIENYVVEIDGDKKFLRATGFSCTRPWLQNVLTDFGHRQRIELPAWAAAAL